MVQVKVRHKKNVNFRRIHIVKVGQPCKAFVPGVAGTKVIISRECDGPGVRKSSGPKRRWNDRKRPIQRAGKASYHPKQRDGRGICFDKGRDVARTNGKRLTVVR